MEDYKFKNDELVDDEKEKEQEAGGKMSDRTRSIISNILNIAIIAIIACGYYSFYSSDSAIGLFIAVTIAYPLQLFKAIKKLDRELEPSGLTVITSRILAISAVIGYLGVMLPMAGESQSSRECATERVCECVVYCNHHGHSTYSTCD